MQLPQMRESRCKSTILALVYFLEVMPTLRLHLDLTVHGTFGLLRLGLTRSIQTIWPPDVNK